MITPEHRADAEELALHVRSSYRDLGLSESECDAAVLMAACGYIAGCWHAEEADLLLAVCGVIDRDIAWRSIDASDFPSLAPFLAEELAVMRAWDCGDAPALSAAIEASVMFAMARDGVPPEVEAAASRILVGEPSARDVLNIKAAMGSGDPH